jgi:hypothetical protein
MTAITGTEIRDHRASRRNKSEADEGRLLFNVT